MSANDQNDQHVEFEVSYLDNDQVKIGNEDGYLLTEYVETAEDPRKYMCPADMLFSAFAL